MKTSRNIAELRAVHALAATQLDVTPEPSYENGRNGGQSAQRNCRSSGPQVRRKSLVIGNSAHNILDYDPLDGEELLIRLRNLATGPDFTYSHAWKVGDLMMWDNTGTLALTDYPLDCDRMMHRTKLEGQEPIA